MPRPYNILVILSDQHRGDWLGFLGGRQPVRTPHIDALARRGVAFVNAITPSPLCAPARAAFATGRAYDRCPVKHNGQDLPTDAATIYRLLRDRGYHVATCGKLDLLKGAADWGADGQHRIGAASRLHALGFTGGLDSGGKHDAVRAYLNGVAEPYLAYLAERGLAETHVRDYEARGQAASDMPLAGDDPVHFVNTAPTLLPDEAYGDNWIGRSGHDLIAGMPSDTPWFLQVNFSGPHEPMDVTAAMQAGWADALFAPPSDLGRLTPAQHLAIRRNYAAMIETVDQWVGRYVALLEERGELERTIVVYASDHGEMLGDRRLWAKHVPFQPSVHVPLVLRGGDFSGGRRAQPAVTLLDLAATVLDTAGIEPPATVEGRSLRAILAEGADRRTAFAGLGCWRLAFDGRFKLVAGYEPAMPRREMMQRSFAEVADLPVLLYDLGSDPEELRDVAAVHPQVTEALRAQLDAWVTAPGGRT